MESLQPEKYVTSRRKTLGYLAICIVFVAIGVIVLPNHRRGDYKYWVLVCAVAFFGLGSVRFAWLLVFPQQLLLDPDGFSLFGGFARKPRKILWKDIDSFFIVRVGRGELIGFSYVVGKRPKALLSKTGQVQGVLPRSWALSSQQMVDRLNVYRRRALGH